MILHEHSNLYKPLVLKNTKMAYMSVMTFQITADCVSNSLVRLTIQKTSKLHIICILRGKFTGHKILAMGQSFVSISRRHHVSKLERVSNKDPNKLQLRLKAWITPRFLAITPRCNLVHYVIWGHNPADVAKPMTTYSATPLSSNGAGRLITHCHQVSTLGRSTWYQQVISSAVLVDTVIKQTRIRFQAKC